MASWTELGGPARTLGTAVGRAVEAAREADRDAYGQAVDVLLALPVEQVGQVQGAILRALLEQHHPDGLDGDDIRDLLRGCYAEAVGWLPPDRVDPGTMTAAVASALGVHEPGITYQDITGTVPEQSDEDGAEPGWRVPTAAGYNWHAPFLIAYLLGLGRRPLRWYLDTVFSEMASTQAMDQP